MIKLSCKLSLVNTHALIVAIFEKQANIKMFMFQEDDRLRDNYIRLKVLKHHALVLNMTTRKLNVVVEIGNLHRAVKRMVRFLEMYSSLLIIHLIG